MKNDKWKAVFSEADDTVSINQKRKEESVRILKTAVTEKKISYRISKFDLLKSQMRFMEKSILAMQGLCIFLFLFTYNAFGSDTQEQYFLGMGAVFASLLGIFIVLSCSKEYTARVSELAESCFFNTKQICTIRMILYGCIDLFLITIFTAFVKKAIQRSFFEIGIYLLVPFVVSCCCYFGVLLTEIGRRNNYILMASGILIALITAVLFSYPKIYERAALGIWVCVFMIGVAVLAGEIRYLFHNMERGEMICMN